MIHTVASLVATFNGLMGELMPGVPVFHLVDESLLTVTRREGRITPQTMRRLLGHAAAMQDLGVAALLVTCSSVGPAAEAVRPFLEIPVVRVDEAMAEEAVRAGSRIGVIATLRSTLEPTRELIDRTSATLGTRNSVLASLCDGAFEAASRGDTEKHDDLVADGIARLAGQVDVLVLAQASMARALTRLGADAPSIPVLTSPRSAVQRLRSVFETA